MKCVAVLLLLVFFQVLCFVNCEHGCNLPPSFWCSSRSIARKCQVILQCEKFVWSREQQSNNAELVNLTLYYETLCPDCKYFTKTQLWPAFNKVGSLFNLELVPYGNAEEQQDGDMWKFTCQHGPDECLGNLIQTCAIHLKPRMNETFPFIACMEFSDSIPSISAPMCAKKYGVDFRAVMNCVNSPLGNQLEHKMALQTEALDPPHTFVPWITLNGDHTDDIQERAEADLVKLICDTYQGLKPDVCKQSHLGNGKCFRNN